MRRGIRMIQKEFKNVVFEFSKQVSSLSNILYVFLFGSVARGEADKRSDIDFCVIAGDDYKKKISSIALDLEKKYDKNIQLVISKNFEKLDEYFVSQLFKEGILLYGRSPLVKIKDIGFRGYALFSFSLKNINQSEKMKIKRVLYGYSTTKKEKKVYKSFSKGLVKEFNGIPVGRGAVLIPLEKAGIIEEIFNSKKVGFERYDLFRKVS